MKLLMIFFLSIILGCNTTQGRDVAGEKISACPTIAIPENSLILENSGEKLIIFPAKFSPHYTGCAYSWLNNENNVYSVARFEKGDVVEGNIRSATLPPMYCAPGKSDAHPEFCAIFSRFWRDAFNDSTRSDGGK